MLCIEDLLTLEPFQQLPKERLEWVCDRAQMVTLQAGDVLVQEGDPPERVIHSGQQSNGNYRYFVTEEGRLQVYRGKTLVLDQRRNWER